MSTKTFGVDTKLENMDKKKIKNLKSIFWNLKKNKNILNPKNDFS
jgi:hypothetical protein